MKTNIITKRLFFISLLIFAVAFVLTPVITQAFETKKTDDTKYTQTGDEKFDRLFREARDHFDKEEWKEAVEKFNQIVCDCPDKKDVAKAFYYLANSYKKLKMYKEAQGALERLVKNFPDTGWASDAQVMMLELSGNTIYRPPTTNGGTRTPVPKGEQGFYTITGSGNLYVPATEAQLDREDEIKLAAFQSLLASDPKRAIEVLGQMLKADSKASETLKREVIRTLRNRSYRGQYFGGHWLFEPAPIAADVQDSQTRVQLLASLRDAYLRAFQDNKDVKIRTEIIYSLIAFNDDQSANYLSQLYTSESDKEIKKAIITAFGSAGNGFYFAYPAFGAQFTTSVATTLGRVQTAENLRKMEAETAAAQSKVDELRVQAPSPAPKAAAETAVVAAGQGGSLARTITPKSPEFRKIYFDKLMEITRSERDSELKRLALSNLQKFTGWSTRDGMFDILSQMYDAESDEGFKASLIQTFSSMKQDQATNKLLSIARSDKSDKLRLEAIYSLRGNKNPEVIKFLEDLIK
jgi:tetratricopeptide (TPR) repeat protein